MTQLDANNLFEEKKHVFLDDGGSVDAAIVVSSISRALSRLEEDYRRIIDKCTIFYVYNNPEVKTICGDENMNVYISINYVYSVLKMDENLISALLHNAFSHFVNQDFIEERRFLADGMPKSWKRALLGERDDTVQLTLPIHYDLNIAFEIRAKAKALKDGIISKEALEDTMNALCLNTLQDGLPLNSYYYSKVMDSLRAKEGHSFPSSPAYKPNDDFASGYFEAFKKLILEK